MKNNPKSYGGEERSPKWLLRSPERNPKSTAAFFDVDGTIVNTTIVHYYVQIRSSLLPAFLRPFWFAWFALKAVYYVLLDKASRSTFNRVFYRNYRRLRSERVKQLAEGKLSQYLIARIFPAALDQVRTHKNRGELIVLVTGSLDFIVQPLAAHLNADHVLSVQLREENGRFTGELVTEPLAGVEKANAVTEFAKRHNIELSRSYAYGDSEADVPMLQCVGNPCVINPKKQFRRIARTHGWRVLRWTEEI